MTDETPTADTCDMCGEPMKPLGWPYPEVYQQLQPQRNRALLEEMIGGENQYWDFSDNDIAALDWALAEIDRLNTENYRLRFKAMGATK